MRKTKESRTQRVERLAGMFAYCSQKLTGQEVKTEIAGVLNYGKGGKR